MTMIADGASPSRFGAQGPAASAAQETPRDRDAALEAAREAVAQDAARGGKAGGGCGGAGSPRGETPSALLATLRDALPALDPSDPGFREASRRARDALERLDAIARQDLRMPAGHEADAFARLDALRQALEAYRAG